MNSYCLGILGNCPQSSDLSQYWIVWHWQLCSGNCSTRKGETNHHSNGSRVYYSVNMRLAVYQNRLNLCTYPHIFPRGHHCKVHTVQCSWQNINLMTIKFLLVCVCVCVHLPSVSSCVCQVVCGWINCCWSLRNTIPAGWTVFSFILPNSTQHIWEESLVCCLPAGLRCNVSVEPSLSLTENTHKAPVVVPAQTVSIGWGSVAAATSPS